MPKPIQFMQATWQDTKHLITVSFRKKWSDANAGRSLFRLQLSGVARRDYSLLESSLFVFWVAA